MQDFHRIRAWRKAFALAMNVRRAVAKFPPGYAGLKAQILDSVESIGFNICEGSAAATNKEYARFLGFSIKSTTELEGQLEYAHGYGVLSNGDFRSFTNEAIDIRRMTLGLRRTVLGDDEPNSLR